MKLLNDNVTIKLSQVDIEAVRKALHLVSAIQVNKKSVLESGFYFSKHERKSLRKLQTIVGEHPDPVPDPLLNDSGNSTQE